MEITLLIDELCGWLVALSESVGAGNFQELFSKSVGVLIFQISRALSMASLAASQRSVGRRWPPLSTAAHGVSARLPTGGGRYFIYRPPPGTRKLFDLQPTAEIKDAVRTSGTLTRPSA